MSKHGSQADSEGIMMENPIGRQSDKLSETDMSALKTRKEKKTSDFVAEYAYQSTKEDTFTFLTKKIDTVVPQSFRRPPLLDPADLFTVKLKKSPASSTIKVDNGETLPESSRKQLRFNRCATTISQIYSYLFISGDVMAKNLLKLQEKGIKYILNLAPSVCKNYFEKEKHFTYMSLNLIDSTSEIDMLWAFLRSIDFIEVSTNAQPSRACFVHCHQGVSRSGAVMVAYVMHRDKLTFREAFEIVKAKHAVCSPNAAFIAQLLKFEKRLGLGATSSLERYEEEVFLVKRHSARDPTLIMKPLDSDKLTANQSSVGSLHEVIDVRGTFVVYKSSSKLEPFKTVLTESLGVFSGVFFVYQGQQAGNKASFKHSAIEYINLMKKYIPQYEQARALFVGSNGQLLDLNTTSGLDFFTVLGMKDRTFKTQQHMDKFFEGVADKNALQKPGLADVLQSVSKDQSLVSKLFICKTLDGKHSFEQLEEYDSEDLSSNSAYILESFNNEEDSIKYFIWLGKDVETIINQQAVIELCTDYINSDLKISFMKAGQNITDKGTEVESEGSESKDFLIAFDSGL